MRIAKDLGKSKSKEQKNKLEASKIFEGFIRALREPE